MINLHKGGDLQSTLTRLPGFPWAKYKGEMHLLGHSYTGPGTNLDIRLDENDKPKTGEDPINRIDQAALKHDIIYRDHKDIETRHNADLDMIRELESIQNPTFREKVERAFIIRILRGKMKLGMGLSEEIHKDFRKQYPLLKVKVYNKDDIWSADVIYMPKERGYKYMLTVIDLYTRFAWAVPMKRKDAITTKNSLEKIMKVSKRQPNKLWVDRGKEFYNKHVQSLPFEIYSTYNDGKAVVIERFNRTFKKYMFKKMTENKSQKWFQLYPKVIDYYNNKKHSSIGVSPQYASDNPEEIKDTIKQSNYQNENTLTYKEPKFKVNDRVRIFKWKTIFSKEHTGYFTNEIFIVDEIVYTSPITYRLKDLNGEQILGKFYAHELQKTDF